MRMGTWRRAPADVTVLPPRLADRHERFLILLLILVLVLLDFGQLSLPFRLRSCSHPDWLQWRGEPLGRRQALVAAVAAGTALRPPVENGAAALAGGTLHQPYRPRRRTAALALVVLVALAVLSLLVVLFVA